MAPRAVPGRPAAPVLDWIVFKVVQRCNLNCTYCYVYNRGDDSWKSRPKRASVDVTDQLARRIREHCEAFALTDFTVELHGGEPLLLGKPRMRDLLERLHLGVGPGISLKIVMQTNGLLLDHEWLELLAYYGVTFGLSLDGPPDIADRRRVTLDGRGSTEPLLRRIADLRSRSDYFDALNSGVLCVLDPDADGRALVEWFADNGFRGLDFLLPDGNWENPPQDWRGSDTYAPVLLSAFDAWLGLGDRAPRIRIFDVMMMGLMGVRPHLDAFGGDLRGLCVVESDGGIGVVDTIRICGEPFSRDTLNIFDHPLGSHAEFYGLETLQRPSDTCRDCSAFAACRGGYLPHRFDRGSFDHPSIHCGALFQLTERMVETLATHLPKSAVLAG
jgi:uncharacterized protein